METHPRSKSELVVISKSLWQKNRFTAHAAENYPKGLSIEGLWLVKNFGPLSVM
jgi:hypothetical protein